jgi:hypothetical protein
MKATRGTVLTYGGGRTQPTTTKPRSGGGLQHKLGPSVSRTHDGPQPSVRGEPTDQSPEVRCETRRFDISHGRQALIAQKMKNQRKAKTSNGEAFASSMRAVSRKPRKPATPRTVTAKSAIPAIRSLVRQPMTFPSMLTRKDGRESIGKRAGQVGCDIGEM